ncbi:MULTISPECIES: hypothetical protein [Kordiimonas]|uniref:Uncharacterized protein n=1 Tax=Kordiimonas lacus TaxID=637679 RepID=A0A1G6UME5_9PROT|nr:MULTISPECIES: hypothetical protein [Kordiimonas]SDD42528.1 hypothetical protein SAMN04488071_0637 [Kordiimonas lacus]
MNESNTNSVLGGITAKAILFAALAAVILTLIQFFLEVQQAKGRTAAGVEGLIMSLEKPAARAVLILDAELAHDIAGGLLEHRFITEARIFEDHNVVLGEAKRSSGAKYSMLQSIVGLFVGLDTEVSRELVLPESMSEATGEIRVSFNERQAVTSELGGICVRLFLTFLIAVIAILAVHAHLSRRNN